VLLIKLYTALLIETRRRHSMKKRKRKKYIIVCYEGYRYVGGVTNGKPWIGREKIKKGG